MDDADDRAPARKGKLSAFALLKSWLFSKDEPDRSRTETEFLNTRDGYELARFAKQAFGGDAEAKRAHDEAVAAEQAEIDALLQGTGAVPMPTAAVAPVAATPVATAASVPAVAPAAATLPARPAAAAAKPSVDAAVAQLEVLHAQGFSVEMLAEALIVIESREVKRRANKAA